MLKKTVVFLIGLVVLTYVVLLATGHKYILTAFARTYLAGNATANINDHSVFATRTIETGVTKPWSKHPRYTDRLPNDLAEYVGNNSGAAFVVVHEGQLVSEQYFKDYGAANKTNSFSMAKTVVTLLLGKTIEEGYVKGLDQPLVDFLPEFKDDANGARATIGSLSTMTSGYDWDEHYYNAFSPTVKLLYGDDIEEFLLEGQFSKSPESHFYYSSASTQLLAITLTRALKAKNPDANLSDYLSEKLWRPLGMNDDGLWHLDNSGMELAFCCINTNARNFAKLGQLMLQDGVWEGQQLIPAPFIEMIRMPKAESFYGFSTWIKNDNQPPYYSFRGHLGQYIIVVPQHELVIVRLGESRVPGREAIDKELAFYIDEALEMIPN